MPWDPSSPPEAFKKYDEKCRRAAVRAANSVLQKTNDEGRAIAAGHSAAKQCEVQKSMEIFKIFAPSLTASIDPETKKRRVEGVASSTVRDRHGDQMTVRALRKMESESVGLTAFMNHKYDVPDSIFGVVKSARIMRTGENDPDTGEEIFLLKIGIDVEESNPKAVQAHTALLNGTRLGISIGAMVPDGGATLAKGGKAERYSARYIVDDLDVVEYSVVGLPANPRSFIDYVVKSLSGEYPDALDRSSLEVAEEAPTDLHLDLGEIPLVEQSDEGEKEGGDEEAATPGADEALEGDAATTPDDASVEEREETADEAADEGADTIEAIKKTTVDVFEEADGRKVVSVNTGRKPKADAAQSAQDDPENADGAGSNASGNGTQKDLDDLDAVKLLAERASEDTMGTLRVVMAQLQAQRADNAELRKERDAAIDLARVSVDGTKALIEQLSNLPVGRKTAFGEIQKEFKNLEGIYDEGALKILRS